MVRVELEAFADEVVVEVLHPKYRCLHFGEESRVVFFVRQKPP